MNLLKRIKRTIISNQLFWRIRHLLQPGYLVIYTNKDTSNLTTYLSDFYFDSFLDFGCATGACLYNFKKNNINSLCYGVDINPRSLDIAKEKFRDYNQKTWEFEKQIDPVKIDSFLIKNSINKFNITIFDRVLYCLNTDKIHQILEIITKKTDHIYIDDFELPTSNTFTNLTINGYAHRKWNLIMNEYGFKIIKNLDSITGVVDGAYPKSMLFKSENF